MLTKLVLAACVLGTMGVAAQQRRFDGQSLWRHVEVLAADDMEGRGTGTPGLERAQAYVVDQLQKVGLAPAGTDGYLQPVPILRREIVDNDCSAALVRAGRVESLTIGEDAACTTFTDMPSKVDAPLVFLDGRQVPEKGYDQVGGLKLKGKIAVTITGSGAPDWVKAPLLPYYTPWPQFRQAGIIGWIVIPAPAARWASFTSHTGPQVHLTSDVDDSSGERLFMYFNPAHAGKLFEGTGHTVAELFELARANKPLPQFELPVSLRAAARVVNTPIASSNVVAKLEGRDPQLRNEYVVLSAHLDHLGIGEPVNGDRIYNGAIDNASGVAALLDIAAALKSEGARPRRSVLFTFFTSEERGKFGSKYFAAHPTVDRRSIVANINIDGIQAIVPLKALLVLGEHESDLGDAARRVAAAHDIAMDVDLEPQANRFTCCSDQGSFALAGVPAIKLNVGFPGELNQVQEKWRRERYHTPFDDARQPVNFDTIAKFEEIARTLLLDVADSPRRPEWKPSSIYKR